MPILDYFSPGEFFDTAGPNDFRPGQFCQVVVPYIDPIPKILDVERKNPEEHEQVKFELRPGNRVDDFRKRDRILPIKNLNLRSHEELLVQRAKRRPGIILSANNMDRYPEMDRVLRQMGKKHLQEDITFVLPCYGVQNELDGYGFPPAMVSRIRCLMYRQFFYFPGNDEVEEGIIRLDRIRIVVGKDYAAIRCLKTCLSEEVFPILQSLFIYCLTGTENCELQALRSLTMAAFPAERT